MRTNLTLRSDKRRGVVMLEAALTLTLAMISMIVLLELGITFMAYQGAAERARAGARYAAIAPDDIAGIKNVVVYGNVAGTGSPLLGLDVSEVSVSQAVLDNEADVTSIAVNVESQLFLGGFLLDSATEFTARAAVPAERVFEP